MKRAAVIACYLVSASALLVPRHATETIAPRKPLSAAKPAVFGVKPFSIMSTAKPATVGVKPSAISIAAPAVVTLLASEPANAAANVVLPSAFAAYGHYLGLFVAGMALAAQGAAVLHAPRIPPDLVY